MARKISGQLQTPADEVGDRIDIHLITTTDEVILADGSMNLTEKIEHDGIQISKTKPEYKCTWFQPK